MEKPDGMNDRLEAADPVEARGKISVEGVEQILRRETLYNQCGQFREAVIDLCWLIAKKLRLQEICAWIERFLNGCL